MQNVIGFVALFVAALVVLAQCDGSETSESAAYGDTYRLISAKGNTEREVARGLSKRECESRKEDLKTTAGTLGLHNEALGIGSITCLPESVFQN